MVIAVGDMLSHVTTIEIHFVIPIVVRVVLDNGITGNARIAAMHRSFLRYGPGERLTKAIARMPPPKDQKELKSFLASTNVVRSHVENYNGLVKGLFQV